MKKCIKCGKEQNEEEFYPHQNHCKTCEHNRRKNYYKKHKKEEVQNVLNRRKKIGRDLKKEAIWNITRREKLRLEVLIHYGGSPPKCACCRETIIEFLTIDHIKGDGNKHREKVMGNKKIAGNRFYQWLKNNHYPKGFQVLCMNCNFAKAYRGGCPHQYPEPKPL